MSSMSLSWPFLWRIPFILRYSTSSIFGGGHRFSSEPPPPTREQKIAKLKTELSRIETTMSDLKLRKEKVLKEMKDLEREKA